ncbi:hypothetical protein GCM10007388_15610 [Pseudoduganella plicata]|uniref:Uncharacterized protein n=1 Tax=Pseudoduganella plicata TaxID=321984 RepID=A0AA88C5T7_9BURK|nr:hypothetical protein GCM10007388_15610 [Pseudoduganella plicata]
MARSRIVAITGKTTVQQKSSERASSAIRETTGRHATTAGSKVDVYAAVVAATLREARYAHADAVRL